VKTCNDLEQLILDVGLDWVNKRGTFPKRLSRAIKMAYGLNLDPISMSKIGTKAAEFCDKTKDFYLDFTDDLTWSAGDFGDEGSCYWGGRKYARHMLMQKGCHAMRFWAISALDHANNKKRCIGEGWGTGRVWIIPKSTMHGDVLIAFNAYRTDGRPIVHSARILATVMGSSYKRIGLLNNRNQSGIIYINGGHGFVLGPQDVCEKIDSLDLDIKGPWGRCKECGDEMANEDDVCDNDDCEPSDPCDMLCRPCHDGSVSHTYHCAACRRSWTPCSNEEDQLFDTRGRIICETCSADMHQCPRCNRYSREPLLVATRLSKHLRDNHEVYFLYIDRKVCAVCGSVNTGNYLKHTCPKCNEVRLYANTSAFVEGVKDGDCHVCQKFKRNI
jgi:hypothetical protein